MSRQLGGDVVSTLAEVTAARQALEPRLFQDPNIIGVGSGYKRSGGEVTDEPSLIVFVETKLPASRLGSDRLLPSRYELYAPLAEMNLDVTTDVVQVDRISALSRTGRYRPAPGGVSVGHPSVTAGTLGCYVRDRSTGDLLILSNCHVLAGQGSCRQGDPILQQAPLDGGSDTNAFATLSRWVPLEFGSDANLVDAAVAKPLLTSSADLSLLDVGAGPNAAIPARIGMRVQKSGRTTGRTRGGEIISVDTTFRVDYGYAGRQRAGFRDAIVVLGPPGFSQPGDSGSVVVTDDADAHATGLLFAANASGTFSLANHVQHVFNLLDVDLVNTMDLVLQGSSWVERGEDLGVIEARVLGGTEQGRQVLDVLKRHNSELWGIFSQEPDLTELARRLLVPLLNALYAEDHPQSLVFDRTYFAEAKALIGGIREHGSLPLQKAMTWLYGELWRYEDKDIVGIIRELQDPSPIPSVVNGVALAGRGGKARRLRVR